MKLKVFFSCLVLVFLSFKSLSQESFPVYWEGNYKGDLEIYGVDSIAMRVTMKLAIKKKSDSIFQWKITYDFKGKEDVRDYVLNLIDAEKGYYVIDEKNTIVIDSYFKTNIFTSFFEVQDSFLVSTYTKILNKISDESSNEQIEENLKPAIENNENNQQPKKKVPKKKKIRPQINDGEIEKMILERVFKIKMDL